MKLSLSLKAICTVAFLNFITLSNAHAAADAVVGKTKAQVCFSCHGASGISSFSGIPHLAAQPSLSIVYQLIQFKEKRRVGGDMESMAMTLNEQDMRDIAAYFASLPPPPAKSADEAKVALGQKISQQNYCQSCHGAQLQGQKHVPRLAGQDTKYFITQLKNIRSAVRVDMDGTMGSAARNLTDDDIQALAEFAKSMN